MQGCTHVPAACKKVNAEEETDQNVDDAYSAQRLQPLPQRTPQVWGPSMFQSKKQALPGNLIDAGIKLSESQVERMTAKSLPAETLDGERH